jgi:hypothetical protein
LIIWSPEDKGYNTMCSYFKIRESTAIMMNVETA